ncbi:MAG: triose-phosphate isomerase [Acetilactobacillus jinshanensis]
MNLTLDKVVPYLKQLTGNLPSSDQVETAIAASPLFLQTMLEYVRQHHLPLRIGAENCYYKDSGAYTGEVSPKALAQMGVHYVIVGHSERRKYFHESDRFINKKIRAVLRNHMNPIVCCDETMGRLGSGKPSKWVVTQVISALHHVSAEQARHVTIAYEPSWAIGTGHSASPDEAEEGCYLIRHTLSDIYSDAIADRIRILYGGSVNPRNVRSLMKQTDIDGVLAGGSSLKASTFLKLIKFKDLKCD